ncbi:MAG TPA: hypothetical protein VFA66_10595 [Gaiellaceae bacterium]|nr:hypothetical protein [Gaiellaceae bacterium]
MKSLAVAVFALAGVLAAAAGFSIYVWGYRSDAARTSYAGYGPVIRQLFALNRYDVAKVKHIAGPFYALRYRSRSRKGKQYCLMIDVSTRYKATSNDPDRFWTTNGFFGANSAERSICNF